MARAAASGGVVRFDGAPDFEADRSSTVGFWSAPGFTPPSGTRLAGTPRGWCVRCERADGTLHGPATFWRRRASQQNLSVAPHASTIEIAGAWRDGVRHGPEVARRGGGLCWEGAFSDGLKDGEWRYFDQAGALLLANRFEAGVLMSSQVVTKAGMRELAWKAGALVSADDSPESAGESGAVAFSVDGRALESLAPVVGSEPKVLRISGASRLPSELWTLRSLRELHLEGSSFTRLPPALGDLEHLEVLSLHHVPVQQLPSELGRLTRLRQLSISFSSLVGLPAELTRLAALEKLEVVHSPLVAVPEGLGACRSLKELRLENVRLESLPESLGDTPLAHLRVVDAYTGSFPDDGLFGQLRSLPASLARCPLDGSFEVAGHLITHLPDGLGARQRFVVKNVPLLRLPRLRTEQRECRLCFDADALEALPESLAEVKAFSLSFDGNLLVEWPAALERTRLVKPALTRFKKRAALDAKLAARQAKTATPDASRVSAPKAKARTTKKKR